MDKINLNKIKQRDIKELLEFSIININKPSGCTSFDVDFKIKKLLGLRKTSHFGTLDPMVTGVLPVALNRACKLSDFFMHRDKIYIGEFHLHSDISLNELKKEMKKFLGIIEQMPPIKSRVKRVLRKRRINKFEILDFNKNKKDVEFLADVEAGTYIRKLIHDLGENIGGAHMTKLKRIKAGLFEEKDSITMKELESAIENYKNGNEKELKEILIPGEIISKLYPIIDIKENLLKKLLTGKPFIKGEIEIPSDIFVVFYKNKFIEIAKKVNEGEIIARPLFVLN